MKHRRCQGMQLSTFAGVVLAACTPTAVPGTTGPRAGEATAAQMQKAMTVLH